MQLQIYLTPSGMDVFGGWLAGLADARAKSKVAQRLARVIAGNFGDCRPLQDGVWELRSDHGPGYRIYHAMAGREIVLLLCGGDKRRQSADIARAIVYWKDYKQRTGTS